jgi:hypothetical protein
MAAKVQGVDASSGEAQKSAAAPASKPPHERNFVVILLLIVTPLARAAKCVVLLACYVQCHAENRRLNSNAGLSRALGFAMAEHSRVQTHGKSAR